jgi:hypothetical protein
MCPLIRPWVSWEVFGCFVPRILAKELYIHIWYASVINPSSFLLKATIYTYLIHLAATRRWFLLVSGNKVPWCVLLVLFSMTIMLYAATPTRVAKNSATIDTFSSYYHEYLKSHVVVMIVYGDNMLDKWYTNHLHNMQSN